MKMRMDIQMQHNVLYVEKLKSKTEAWVRNRTGGTTHTNGTTSTTVTEGEAVPF